MNDQAISSGTNTVDTSAQFSWLDIVRLGFVQAALGSIVVLTTSAMNRIMVIELALPAAIPGALVGLHYAVQIMRPRMGYGSDMSGRRTPWILGGLAVLGAGAILASVSIGLASHSWAGALLLSTLAFTLIGVGVGASGTALLTLLAMGSGRERRAPAATIVWVMMIVGFIVTTAVVGQLLDPYSPQRLIAITSMVALCGWLVAALATWRLESRVIAKRESNQSIAASRNESGSATEAPVKFMAALAQVWAEPTARQFAFFVFVSMLAYSAQDLILEPFAGSVFSMTPGESTSLSSLQHGGVLLGMIFVAVAAGTAGARPRGSMWAWTLFGCLFSALALLGLAGAAVVGANWPIKTNVFVLGAANGAYAVAAIASMMNLVSSGTRSREGLRMGMWGAAQALAFGLGGFLGAFASDAARYALSSPALGYGVVFAIEAALFLVSGVLALRLSKKFTKDFPVTQRSPNPATAIYEGV